MTTELAGAVRRAKAEAWHEGLEAGAVWATRVERTNVAVPAPLCPYEDAGTPLPPVRL